MAVPSDVGDRRPAPLKVWGVIRANVIAPALVETLMAKRAAGDEEILTFIPLANEMDRMEWRSNGHRVEILPATLGDWAGATGAAYQANQSLITLPLPLKVWVVFKSL